MANIGRGLVLRLAVNSGPLGSGLATAAGMISTFAGKTKSAVGGMFSGLGDFGRNMAGISFLKDTFTSLLGTPLQVAGEFEKAAVSFEVLLGDAAKGKAMMEDLYQFAAKTPFELPEVQQAAKTLLGMGLTSEQIMPALQMLGDTAALTGKDFGELAVIFGKVASKGKLQGEEWLQLQEAGLGRLKPAMMKRLGIESADVFEKMKEQGQITFATLAGAFEDLTGPGGPYNRGMDKLSGTLLGKWSTLKDGFNQILKGVGEAALEGLGIKSFMDDAGQAFEWVGKHVKDWLLPPFIAIGGILRGLGEIIRELWNTVIGPWLEGMTGGVRDVGGGIKSWRNITITAIQGLLDALDPITSALSKLGEDWGEALFGKLGDRAVEFADKVFAGFARLVGAENAAQEIEKWVQGQKLDAGRLKMWMKGPNGERVPIENWDDKRIEAEQRAVERAGWFGDLRARLGALNANDGGAPVIPPVKVDWNQGQLQAGVTKGIKFSMPEAMEAGTQKAWETIVRSTTGAVEQRQLAELQALNKHAADQKNKLDRVIQELQARPFLGVV